ncbi:hypothetical protein [Nocardia fluminea]|uniref:hypothetical protein n=1 Tax=Nocardia fluminea TaxID=134984 RepID=UPI00117F8D33|nr:hypothetical protein [Nocardia fluminea]
MALQIRYIPRPLPSRFRLERESGAVVETQLVGEWKIHPSEPGEFFRGDNVVGWMVRLEDGTEWPLDQLLGLWGETKVGTPDLSS